MDALESGCLGGRLQLAQAAAPRRVLVFRTGHLGDTVCAIPAFRLVRRCFAGAELTLLCDRPQGAKVAAAEVIRRLDFFDRIRTYASHRGPWTAWKLWRAVRQARPDLVILLPQVRESPEDVGRKTRFFRRCGVADVRGHLLPVSAHEWQPNEPQRLVQMLHRIGVRGDKPGYAIPGEVVSRESGAAKLRAVGVEAGAPYLVFCGGGKVATQRWPLDRYATVLARVAAALQWPVVGLGSPSEVENYRRLILPRFPALKLLPGALKVPEIFELCRLATVYLGNDTGPMHVAAAVGCPVIAVVSARNPPGAWDPDVEPRLVFRNRTACEDCFLDDCVTQQHRCLTGITVEWVEAGVIPFLRSLGPRRRDPDSICAALPDS